MNRKTFITSLAAGVVLVGSGTAGLHLHLSSRNDAKRVLSYNTLGEALQEIENLQRAVAQVDLAGDWTLYQHLRHCSQSIAFSMQGFPSQKSALFQRTLGRWAFRHFLSQGYMRHHRNEPLPDAPAIVPHGDVQAAFSELIQTIHRFDNHTGALQPHFAYGVLSKKEYEKAHAMHLADHFAVMTY